MIIPGIAILLIGALSNVLYSVDAVRSDRPASGCRTTPAVRTVAERLAGARAPHVYLVLIIIAAMPIALQLCCMLGQSPCSASAPLRKRSRRGRRRLSHD